MSEQVAYFGFLVIDFLPDFGERQDAFFPPGGCGVFADFQQPDNVAVVEQLAVLVASVQRLPDGIEALDDLIELLVGHLIKPGCG
jgi:hypothetical protein